MSRKSILSLGIFGVVVLIIGLNTSMMPSYAQTDTPPATAAVTITLTGKITALTDHDLTLDDGSVVTINKATQGLTADVKVGVVVTIQAEVDNEAFVATSITLGQPTDGTDTPPANVTPAPTQDAGKGKGNGHGHGKPGDNGSNATATVNSNDNSGNSNDNGNGNGHGNGHGNSGHGNRNGNGNGRGQSDNGTPEAAATDQTDQAGCLANAHQPVAQRLATVMNISYAQIMAWHCDGNGFGEIARAYLIAKKTGMTVDQVLAIHKAGKGWGDIMNDAGLSPSDLVIKGASGKSSSDNSGNQ